jgi:hypothetical protein
LGLAALLLYAVAPPAEVGVVILVIEEADPLVPS